jgi:hypothetical protein
MNFSFFGESEPFCIVLRIYILEGDLIGDPPARDPPARDLIGDHLAGDLLEGDLIGDLLEGELIGDPPARDLIGDHLAGDPLVRDLTGDLTGDSAKRTMPTIPFISGVPRERESTCNSFTGDSKFCCCKS